MVLSLFPLYQRENKVSKLSSMVIQLENARTKIRTHICLIQVSFTFSYHCIDPIKANPTHLNCYLLGQIKRFWFLLRFPQRSSLILHIDNPTMPILWFWASLPSWVVSSLSRGHLCTPRLFSRTQGSPVSVCQIELS